MLYLGMEGIGLLLRHGKVPFLLSLPVLIRCACARLLQKKKKNTTPYFQAMPDSQLGSAQVSLD